VKKLLAVLAIVALFVALVAGCATIKKTFCSLNFDTLQTQVSNDISYIDGSYNTYVKMLTSGNEKVRPWVVAADLALAQLKPILQGLQKGVCYPQAQVTQALNMTTVAKAAAVSP